MYSMIEHEIGRRRNDQCIENSHEYCTAMQHTPINGTKEAGVSVEFCKRGVGKHVPSGIVSLDRHVAVREDHLSIYYYDSEFSCNTTPTNHDTKVWFRIRLQRVFPAPLLLFWTIPLPKSCALKAFYTRDSWSNPTTKRGVSFNTCWPWCSSIRSAVSNSLVTVSSHTRNNKVNFRLTERIQCIQNHTIRYSSASLDAYFMWMGGTGWG